MTGLMESYKPQCSEEVQVKNERMLYCLGTDICAFDTEVK